MKYYTSTQYTGKAKKKKFLRIVLLTSLAIGILVGAAMLGNLLRERLVRAGDLLDLSPVDYAVREDTTAAPQFTKAPRKRPAVTEAICLPLPADVFASKDALTAALAAHSGDIAVTVTDADGARFKLNAIPGAAETDSLPDTSLLTQAVTQASDTQKHLSATVYTSHSAVTDGDLLAELSQCGVRDVLLYGLTEDTLSAKATYTLLVYLDHLRDRAPDMTVGIALSPALFADGDAATYLDRLAEYFDYLSLDLTNRPADYANAAEYAAVVADKMYGSFAYYDLAVFTDSDGVCAEALTVWEAHGIQVIRSLS